MMPVRRCLFLLAVGLLIAGGWLWVHPSFHRASQAAQTRVFDQKRISAMRDRRQIAIPLPERDAAAIAVDGLLHRFVMRIASHSDYISCVNEIEIRHGSDGYDDLVAELTLALSDYDANWGVNFASALSPGPARDQAIRVAARSFANHDAEQALSWAERIPEAETRALALDSVVNQFSTNQIEKYAAEISLSPSSALGSDEAVCTLVADWVDREPSDALAWFRALPPGLLRTRVMSSIAFELNQKHDSARIETMRGTIAPSDRAFFNEALRLSNESNPGL